MSLTEASIPRLARGHRLRNDAARARVVVLAPERVFEPDETALAVLELVDGARSLGTIIDSLAARYDAPRAEIAVDVTEMLQALVDKGVVAV